MAMDVKRKALLLKDLSARLIYGVKCFVYGDIQNAHILSGIKDDDTAYFKELDWKESDGFVEIEFVTPLLRPMSSMTEKEQKEFSDFCVIDEFAWKGDNMQGYINQAKIMQTGIDWLNKHHFDYQGLIEKGLAIEAKEDLYK